LAEVANEPAARAAEAAGSRSAMSRRSAAG
jgi:hypothetical protein